MPKYEKGLEGEVKSIKQMVDTCETYIALGIPLLKCLMNVFFWRGNITNKVFREHGELSRVVLMVYLEIETVLSRQGIQPVIKKYRSASRIKIRSGCVLSANE